MAKKTNSQSVQEIIDAQVRILPKHLLTELQHRVQLTNEAWYVHKLVSTNTALVPNGQDVAKTLEAIARLLDNDKNQYVTVALKEAGYTYPENATVSIDPNGVITETTEK